MPIKYPVDEEVEAVRSADENISSLERAERKRTLMHLRPGNMPHDDAVTGIGYDLPLPPGGYIPFPRGDSGILYHPGSVRFPGYRDADTGEYPPNEAYFDQCVF